jgi:hypothetical protein
MKPAYRPMLASLVDEMRRRSPMDIPSAFTLPQHPAAAKTVAAFPDMQGPCGTRRRRTPSTTPLFRPVAAWAARPASTVI